MLDRRGGMRQQMVLPVSQEEKNTAAQSAVAVYKRSLLVSNEKKQCKDQVEPRPTVEATQGQILSQYPTDAASSR